MRYCCWCTLNSWESQSIPKKDRKKPICVSLITSGKGLCFDHVRLWDMLRNISFLHLKHIFRSRHYNTNLIKQKGPQFTKEWNMAIWSLLVYSFYMLNIHWGKLDWKKISVVLKLKEETWISCARLMTLFWQLKMQRICKL